MPVKKKTRASSREKRRRVQKGSGAASDALAFVNKHKAKIMTGLVISALGGAVGAHSAVQYRIDESFANPYNYVDYVPPTAVGIRL